MNIPFTGPTYQGRSVSINSSRSINFYPEITGVEDDKTIMSLVGTPGCFLFGIAPTTGPIRGMHVFDDVIFTVVGDTLYSVNSVGVFSTIDTLTTSTGRISMADNGIGSAGIGGDQLFICDGDSGYIYNVSTTTFSTISDINFLANPIQVSYADGYFVVIDGSMRFVVSDLYDGLSYNPLATAAVAGLADNISAIVSINQQMFFIKEYNSEIWYNSGTPTSLGSPFLRQEGAVYDYGTMAPWSVAKGGNSVFFVAHTRSNDSAVFLGVVEVQAFQPQVISTPNIGYIVSRSTSLVNCYGYCYGSEGHMFYVLTNPDDDWTLVYDMTTKMWHEWSSFDLGGEPKRHLSNNYVIFNGKHYVGDYRQPILYELSSEFATDGGVPIYSIRTAPHVFDKDELSPLQISRLDIDAETGTTSGSTATTAAYLADGVYLAAGVITAGSILTSVPDPQIHLSWSNDGGKTFGAEYPKSMGAAAAYSTRLVWRRLGISRNRVFKIRISDPIKKNIIGAYVRGGL